MDLKEIPHKAQEAVNSWGNLLMATVRGLKPSKSGLEISITGGLSK